MVIVAGYRQKKEPVVRLFFLFALQGLYSELLPYRAQLVGSLIMLVVINGPAKGVYNFRRQIDELTAVVVTLTPDGNDHSESPDPFGRKVDDQRDIHSHRTGRPHENTTDTDVECPGNPVVA